MVLWLRRCWPPFSTSKLQKKKHIKFAPVFPSKRLQNLSKRLHALHFCGYVSLSPWIVGFLARSDQDTEVRIQKKYVIMMHYDALCVFTATVISCVNPKTTCRSEVIKTSCVPWLPSAVFPNGKCNLPNPCPSFEGFQIPTPLIRPLSLRCTYHFWDCGVAFQWVVKNKLK